MRIKPIHLAGLAAMLAGVGANQAAQADDLSVSTATTTPVTTAQAANNSAGNVTITSTGSIAVTAGQTAVTINSNNTVSNAGVISSSDAINTTGIQLGGGFTGSVTNTGAINLLETYVITDTDSDGDLDGEYATGTNRHGIWLGAGGFTGNITNGAAGAITVEGDNSAGIQTDSLLTGDLNNSGGIAVVGDNSRAILVNQGVTGDVLVGGQISARGQGVGAVEINGDVGGGVRLSGAVVATGFHVTTRSSSQTVLDRMDADDRLLSDATVAIHGDVAEGVLIVGVGVEDDEDDDGDGDTEAEGDTNDDAAGSIVAFGSAPALLIAPDTTTPADVVLGATASGFGLHNRGAITAGGVYDEIGATGVQIGGVTGANVNIAGGVLNDGAVTTTAFEADASGYVLGLGANAAEFRNRSAISTRIDTPGTHTAYGVRIETGANVPTINNSGVISTFAFGEDSNTTAISDRSNTVTAITNSGSIVAQIIVQDTDTTDDEVPVATGDALAIDLTGNTVGALIRQIADTPFTDDDATDNDSSNRPPVLMRGDIRLGSGADRIELLSGNMLSSVSFGAGADTFLINNGATFVGGIDDADGALAIDVVNGQFGHTGGATNLTTAHFGADAEMSVFVSPEAGASTLLNVSGTATFDAGSVITPVIPAGLPESGETIFLTAGNLVGASNVTRTITGAGAPYIYNLAITSPNANALAASYVLKTPTELGLNTNQTSAFMPIVEAMREDDAASAALASIEDSESFFDAYQQLLPDYSSAAAEIAATAIKEAQAASSNRLARTRLSEVDNVSVWVQEIAYGLSRDPKTDGVAYRGSGFGLAAGIDGPLQNGALFGVSGAFVASEVEEPGRRDGEISTWFGQANAYFGTGMGPLNLDIVAGLGAGKMKSARFVDIGEDFSATANAEWWSYEGHVATRVSAPWRLGSRFVVTPRLGLTYVAMQEDAYTETDGGAAINLDVDKATTQRLWGEGGLDFALRFGDENSSFEPRVFIGHRLNIIKDPSERTLRFASGGSDFTLVDEKPGDGGPVVGLGFDSTNGWSTISLLYEGEYGDQIERHSLNAAVRFRF